ncbi:hypothetical protein HN51_043365, partial [Arachis hypogaea]
TGVAEFAKRFRVKGLSKDLSPVSVKNLLNWFHPYGLMGIADKLSHFLVDPLKKVSFLLMERTQRKGCPAAAAPEFPMADAPSSVPTNQEKEECYLLVLVLALWGSSNYNSIVPYRAKNISSRNE